MPFLTEMEHKQSPETARLISAFFDAIRMPLPDFDEYTLSSDGGFLIFLDDVGCVMRGSSEKKCQKIENPMILRPLLSRPITDDFRIDVFPAIRSPALDEEVALIKETLFQDAIIFRDTQIYNVGYLPVQTKDFPHGFPVIIDMGAFRHMAKATREARKHLPPSPVKMFQNDLQEVAFGDLRRAFENAWPQDQGRPDQDKLAQAWQLCTKKTKEHSPLHDGRRVKTLMAIWMQQDIAMFSVADFKGAKTGGEKYARHWQAFSESNAAKTMRSDTHLAQRTYEAHI